MRASCRHAKGVSPALHAARAPLAGRRGLLTLPLWLWAGAVRSDPPSRLTVIAHPGTDWTELDRTGVAACFLGKRRLVGAQPVLAFDLEEEAVRAAFYRIAADMSLIRVTAYWSRLVYSGQLRPPPQVSQLDIQARVAAEPGGLGYLAGAPDAAGAAVTTLFEWAWVD